MAGMTTSHERRRNINCQSSQSSKVSVFSGRLCETKISLVDFLCQFWPTVLAKNVVALCGETKHFSSSCESPSEFLGKGNVRT